MFSCYKNIIGSLLTSFFMIMSGYVLAEPDCLHNPNASHSITTIKEEGWFNIELEEGSRWKVDPDDLFKIMEWNPSDILLITPNNHSASTHYKLINLTTDSSAKVNLIDVPTRCSGSGHWIADYDYLKRIIYLEDGSAWQEKNADPFLFENWELNDQLIIGTNMDENSHEYPNILINVRNLNYIRVVYIHD